MRLNSLNIAKACTLILLTKNELVDREVAARAWMTVTNSFHLSQKDDEEVFAYILEHTKALPIV